MRRAVKQIDTNPQGRLFGPEELKALAEAVATAVGPVVFNRPDPREIFLGTVRLDEHPRAMGTSEALRIRALLEEQANPDDAKLQARAQRGIEVLCPEGQALREDDWTRQSDKQYPKNRFLYDPTTDSYTCPAGARLTPKDRCHGKHPRLCHLRQPRPVHAQRGRTPDQTLPQRCSVSSPCM